MKWFDGEFVADDCAPPVAVGLLPFETIGAFGGRLPLWPRHLARLRAALSRLHVTAAEPTGLASAVLSVLERNGHGDGVLRLQVVPHATGTSWIASSRPRSGGATVRLLPCVARRQPAAPPADLKCEPRAFYDAVLAEARAAGADDGIVLGNDGTLLETAVGNLWLCLDGTWCTPPLDGQVLPGICRGLLLERAAARGLGLAERRCDFGDLHRASALAVTNAVHGPRAAALMGGTVAEIDSAMRHLWRDAISD